MISLEKYNDPEYVSKILDFVEKYEKVNHTIDEILTSEKNKANLFLSFISIHFKSYQKSSNENYDFTSAYDTSLLEEIFIHSSNVLDTVLEDAINKKIPYLKIIHSIKMSSFQWYNERLIDYSITRDVYNALKELKTPFNDDRFKALPIYSNSNKSGYSRAEWFKKESGVIKNFYDKESETIYQKRTDTSYLNIFIDAKIGVVIYFKNKPSIVISFNVDSNKNLYIHQVQSQIKDRGHYKIKGCWKEEAILYIKSILPGFKIHLISGSSISKMVSNSYDKDSVPKNLQPNSFLLDRIKKNYDEIYTQDFDFFYKNDICYRKLNF